MHSTAAYPSSGSRPGSAKSAVKPWFALRLDPDVRRVLHRVSEAVATLPSEALGEVALAGRYDAVAEADLCMEFVLCTERLSRLFEDQLHTLSDALKLRIAEAGEAIAAPMTFQRYEQYAPDKSILVARFRLSPELVALRKAVWRECRAVGIAFPDAMWLPHVKLGKLSGLSRGQLDHLSIASLSSWTSPPAAVALGLALAGEWPQGARLDCLDWTAALSFSPERMEVAEVQPPRASSRQPGGGRPHEPAEDTPQPPRRPPGKPCEPPCASGVPARPPPSMNWAMQDVY